MPYRFGDTQLRVVHGRLTDRNSAKHVRNARFLILEHILPTTAELLRLLRDAGGEVFAIIAKPYSVHAESLAYIESLGIHVVRRDTYQDIEQGGVIEELLEGAQARSDEDGRRIVIIDVGGYFARPLAKSDCRHVAGVVEDTTFGHNRYDALIREAAAEGSPEIKVPILSVARSPLKEIEARFVGKDAVVSMDLLLRSIGVTISGRNALVIGYGMIGKNVARTLRRYDLKVYVYDKQDTMNLQAHADGFSVSEKRQVLECADIIFSATGSEAIHNVPAVSYREIETRCRDGVVLASVGSRKTEFDVEQLKSSATSSAPMQTLDGRSVDDLVRYRLSKNHDVILARDGAAVNFYMPSIPIEVLDLVFSEIVVACLRLLRDHDLASGPSGGPSTQLIAGAMESSDEDDMHGIAKDWLSLANKL